MRKNDLMTFLHEKWGKSNIPYAKVHEMVHFMMEGIMDFVLINQKGEIPNKGTFKLKRRKDEPNKININFQLKKIYKQELLKKLEELENETDNGN